MRIFVVAVAVLILMLSIATLTAAGAPELTRNIGPPEHAQAQWENGLPPGLLDKGIPPGLQDKGGLPPGMHGREVLPPGIQMRFVNILQGQWEGKEEGFYILGSEYIDISADEPLTETYQAVLVDEDGNGRMVTAEAEWTLDLPEEDGNDNGQESGTQAEEGVNGLEGISITEYGVLEIEAGVEPTTIMINASYTATADEGQEPETFNASLQVVLYNQEIAAVEIVGAEFVALSGDYEEDSMTLEYTALVKDNMGLTMEGEEVIWEMESEDYGEGEDISYIVENNKLTVDLPAIAGEFTITATASATINENGNDSIYAELTVTIYEPVATSVAIQGAANIELPAEGEVITEEYTANVLDQFGQIMIEGAAVRWWIEDEDGEEMENTEEIWLNGDEDTSTVATLTVTHDAEAGTFTLWAAYAENGDSEETEVTGSLKIELLENEPAGSE